jgi:2TM domain
MYDQERYQLARARVQQLRLFYTHVGVYVCVNILLLLINLLTDPSSLWFYWPLLGWGIGVAAHAFLVYGAGGIMGKKWEERKIRQVLEQERMQMLEQERIR